MNIPIFVKLFLQEYTRQDATQWLYMCLLKHMIWRLTDIQTHVHLFTGVRFFTKERTNPTMNSNKWIPVRRTENELNKIQTSEDNT